ncbi:MAG: GspH/FimT family pseudopilin [Nitrospirota bacterium]
MCARSKRHGSGGWTLLETAVVLSLAAIAATAAVPSFDGLTDRLALRSASVTLIQTLRTARHRAMAEGRAYTVAFDPSGRIYAVTEPPGERIALPVRVQFGAAAGVLGPPSQPVRPPPAGGVTFRGERVIFFPDGALSPGPGAIYLSSRRGETMAITLNIAGHLRRYRWEERGEGQEWTPM